MNLQEMMSGHRELWHWISKDGMRKKERWPGQDSKWGRMANSCFPCAYVGQMRLSGIKLPSENCTDLCPVDWGTAGCTEGDGLYGRWQDAVDAQDKCSLAGEIRDLKLKEEHWKPTRIATSIMDVEPGHRNLWNWLADNPEMWKNNWPGWCFNGGAYPDSDTLCLACDYGDMRAEDESKCHHCPFTWPGGTCGPEMEKLFPRWREAENDMLRTKYARQIAELPLKGWAMGEWTREDESKPSSRRASKK